MAKDVAEKYESLRTSISNNINTIRYLLLQADKLNNQVAELKGDQKKKKERRVTG